MARISTAPEITLPTVLAMLAFTLSFLRFSFQLIAFASSLGKPKAPTHASTPLPSPTSPTEAELLDVSARGSTTDSFLPPAPALPSTPRNYAAGKALLLLLLAAACIPPSSSRAPPALLAAALLLDLGCSLLRPPPLAGLFFPLLPAAAFLASGLLLLPGAGDAGGEVSAAAALYPAAAALNLLLSLLLLLLHRSPPTLPSEAASPKKGELPFAVLLTLLRPYFWPDLSVSLSAFGSPWWNRLRTFERRVAGAAGCAAFVSVLLRAVRPPGTLLMVPSAARLGVENLPPPVLIPNTTCCSDLLPLRLPVDGCCGAFSWSRAAIFAQSDSACSG
jgi:hypothetical protein